MDPLFRHRARLGIGAYFALRFLGLIVLWWAGRTSAPGADAPRLFEALFFLGTAALLWGCWALALSKGRSGWLGLAGLAGVLGLIVLALLPDRAPATPPEAPGRGAPAPH